MLLKIRTPLKGFCAVLYSLCWCKIQSLYHIHFIILNQHTFLINILINIYFVILNQHTFHFAIEIMVIMFTSFYQNIWIQNFWISYLIEKTLSNMSIIYYYTLSSVLISPKWLAHQKTAKEEREAGNWIDHIITLFILKLFADSSSSLSDIFWVSAYPGENFLSCY